MIASLPRALAKLGVKTRLLFAFSLMVTLTLAVGTVGWWGISNIQQSLNVLQQESLSEIAQSMALAQQSTSLVAQAPFVANAKILFHLDEESDRLKEKLHAFSQLVQELRPTKRTHSDESTLEGNEPSPEFYYLDSLATRIEGTLLELMDVTRSRIFLDAKMRDRHYELTSTYDAFEEKMAEQKGELIEDLAGRFDLSDQRSQPVGIREISIRFPENDRQFYDLNGIPGEIHRLAGTLIASTTTEDVNNLRMLEARYSRSRQLLQSQLEQLTDVEPVGTLAKTTNVMFDLGEGADSIFLLRREQFANEDRRAYLLTVSNLLSAALSDRVASLVNRIKRETNVHSAEAADVLNTSKARILVLGAICLMAAVVSAFYVMRDLAGNLSAVTRSMIQLAGGNRTIQVPAITRLDEIGNLARACNVFKDNIFKLDAASRQLAENNKLLEAIFHHMNDGLSVFDADGRLVTWNPKLPALYGFSETDISVGMSIEAINVVLEKKNVTARSLDGQLIFPEQIDWERRWKNQRFEECLPDGRVLELRSNPMPEGGFVTVYTDLTERRVIEAQLRQAQKMESVGKLTGGLAHDFNNLLTAIIGNLSLLQEALAGQGKLREKALRALEAADRGAMITQRLLAFSRKQALQPKLVEVNELIEGMVDLLECSVAESIVIDLQLPENLWPVVIDPGQLENALMNLALNSRDAMPEGGRLSIQTVNCPVNEVVTQQLHGIKLGDYVILAVSDTGNGMSEEVLNHVFEPFFTTKQAGAGSGLGLSMVYGFINQSGGHVHIDSAVGRGTTIQLYLPRATTTVSERQPLRRQPDFRKFDYHGKMVMVVEDDDNVRQTAVDMLKSLGCQTIQTTNGQEALALLAKRKDVSLLFTDVVLSGTMSGPEMVREARQRYPDIKVLYCSGYTRNALLEKGYLKSGIELIEKPYKQELLGQKLRDAFMQTI